MTLPPPLVYALALAAVVTSCHADRERADASSLPTPPLARARSLVVTHTLPGPPPGGDGPPRFGVAWRAQVVAPQSMIPRLAIATTDWQGGAAVIDEDRTLWSLHPSRGPLRLAEEVTEVAVSSDGGALGYAVQAALESQVRVRLGGRERVVARDFAAAGTLRFSPDGRALAFVGSRSGGVSGIWVVPIDRSDTAPTCLSNCALRTGTPWGDAFVPPPLRAEDLSFDGDSLRYATTHGREFAARWRGRAP